MKPKNDKLLFLYFFHLTLPFLPQRLFGTSKEKYFRHKTGKLGENTKVNKQRLVIILA